MSKRNVSQKFTEEQLACIIRFRNSGLQWEELTEAYNNEFGTKSSNESLRHAYRRYSDYFDQDSATVTVKTLKQIQQARKTSSKNARENKVILDYLNHKDEILEEIQALISSLPKKRHKAHKLKFRKNKKNMTMELMLSDLHYGKKTKNFDLKIARRRMKELADTLLKEIKRCGVLYNVHRIILALLGDIIESYTMHGLESAKSCEFGNAQQVYHAIESLYMDLILPVAKTGIEIDVPCVTGNHDRTEHSRTYNNPGNDNMTFIIYNTLKMLCERDGFKNVTFYIPEGPYMTLKIYNNTVLYEHGDNSGNYNRDTLEKLLNKRQAQLKKIVDFFRLGHWHEYACYGKGKIIVNESLPGPDSYSDVMGFDSMSGQTLNQYVETKTRPNCFYRSFPIYLE